MIDLEDIDDEETEEIEVKEHKVDEDEKKLAEYYLHQIAIAKKQHEKFYARGEKAIKEYLADFPDSDADNKESRRLNIFNSIINTMLPGYYARTPKAEVNLRKKLGNQLDVIGAQAIENGGQYCLEECQDFDETAINAVKSFLVVGRGVLWERYEVEMEDAVEEVPVLQGADGGWFYADGTPVEDKDISFSQELQSYVVVEEFERVVSEKSITEFVHYKDYLQSPARLESEVDWKARRVYLSKSEFKERFPEFNISELSFDTVPEELEELGHAKDEAKRLHGKIALWELLAKSKKKVMWLCEEYKESAVEVADPEVELQNFFPCAPAIGANLSQDSAVPTCDHHIIADLLKEVERLTSRMHACAEAIRVNAAYDKSLGGLLGDMFSNDFMMIPLDDFKTFAEKGGLDQRIFYAPVEPYAKVLQVLAQSRDDALNKIYEVTGSSDILRGSTSPMETAAAQQLKGNFAQHRFSLRQRQIQAFLSAQFRIKCEIMSGQFGDETLYEICKGEELEQQFPVDQQTGQPQGGFADVLQYVRNPNKLYRIDIETDSMVALDEAQERQDRTDYLNSIGQFISQTLPAMQQYPALAPMFMEMVSFATRSYRAGKELETTIENQLGQFQQQIQQQQQQQGQEQPDPGMQEAQLRLQVAQIEAQVDTQKLQAEGQRGQLDAQLKQFELQIKAEELKLEQEKIRLEYAKLGQDRQLQDLKITEQAVKTQGAIQKEQMDTQQEAIKVEAAVARNNGRVL